MCVVDGRGQGLVERNVPCEVGVSRAVWQGSRIRLRISGARNDDIRRVNMTILAAYPERATPYAAANALPMRAKGRRRGIVAVASKLAVLRHRMWADGTALRPEKVARMA